MGYVGTPQKIWAICDILGGGHYHIRLSKVPIFPKNIVEKVLNRAGSRDFNFFSFSLGPPEILEPENVKKKVYPISAQIWTKAVSAIVKMVDFHTNLH